MALQLNMADTSIGLAVPEAYARIVSLNFNARTGVVSIYVDIYASGAARQSGKNPVSGGVYEGKVGLDFPSLDDTIPGIRATIYSWLKTLPAFAGAIDV